MLKRAAAPTRSPTAARDTAPLSHNPGREQDLIEACAAFERFLVLEAAHDPDLVNAYAEDGVVIERIIENGAERPAREYPLRRYKALLAQALAVSAKAQEASSHRGVSYERLAPGWVLIRSIRFYTHDRGPAPYEATLKREADGVWRVTKEVATLIL